MSSSGSDVRKRIREDVDAIYDEKVKDFIAEALDAKRTTFVTCTKCGKRTEAEFPDWNARASVLKLLLDQGYGRPAEAPRRVVPPVVAPGDSLEHLSDEELEAIAAAGLPDDENGAGPPAQEFEVEWAWGGPRLTPSQGDDD